MSYKSGGMLPSYVINFDELGNILTSSLGGNLGKEIGTNVANAVKNSITDYINNNDHLNNNDFIDNISNKISNNIKNIAQQAGNNINLDTTNLENAINNLKNSNNNNNENIIKLLEEINNKIKLNTKHQQILGQLLEVPAIEGNYKIDFKIEGEINGLSYSQSGWRYEDSFDLKVDDSYNICTNSRTKEVAEHKFLDGYNPCKNKVTFIYHNNSATSKNVWVDLEFFGNIL